MEWIIISIRRKFYAQEKSKLYRNVNLVTVHRPSALMDDQAFKEIIKMIPPGLSGYVDIVNSEKLKKAANEGARAIRDIITSEVKGKLVNLKVDSTTCMERSFWV